MWHSDFKFYEIKMEFMHIETISYLAQQHVFLRRPSTFLEIWIQVSVPSAIVTIQKHQLKQQFDYFSLPSFSFLS